MAYDIQADFENPIFSKRSVCVCDVNMPMGLKMED
jgi:hypothetical protein